MTVNFPIAADAEAALKAPAGRAARERDAVSAAGRPVEFVRELTGPSFQTRAAAEQAYSGLIDIPGQPSIPPEDRFCQLMELAETVQGRLPRGGQAQPSHEGGRRWPQPRGQVKTVWRLSVGYWRLVDPARLENLPQARAARRSEEAQSLDSVALRAMAHQSLQPVKPQQPLDIGLFERRLPEAPDIIVPDE